MPVYTVHAPLAAGADPRSTDRFVFIRDGFHLWAAVLGAVWLAWHRLWLAMLGWAVLMIALDVILVRVGVSGGAIAGIDLLFAILLGFEASSLERWSYSRGNWRQLDIVVADDLDAAERRFFERWAARRSTIGYDNHTVDRGAAPPTRDNGNGQRPPPPLPHASIIGLFPEPGGGR